MEVNYKIGISFDNFKFAEMLVESFVVMTTIFSKCLNSPFSLSFPSVLENDSRTEYVEIELKATHPLIYEEYKSLSKALTKLNWTCTIQDTETNIKTIIQKETIPDEGYPRKIISELSEDLVTNNFENFVL